MKTRLLVTTLEKNSDFEEWLASLESNLLDLFDSPEATDAGADATSSRKKRFPFDNLTVVLRNSADGIGRQRNGFGLEIYISAKYISEFSTDKSVCLKELKGQVVYQLTELLLELICGQNLPKHLASGLCDFARLSLKVESPYWKPKDPPSKWDEGYSKTAFFLQFIQATINKDFVRLLIKAASSKPYSNHLFQEITGKGVDDLFYHYAGFKVVKGKWKETSLQVINKSTNETFALLCADPLEFLESILKATLKLVYPSGPEKYPRINQLHLFIEDMDGVAHCNGGPIPYSSEIHLSTKYITSVVSRHELEEAVQELYGVVRHEMVHAVQSNSFSTLPGGLVEGIADYFRLIAGFPSINWKDKPKKGSKWQNGYADCAYFLQWLEQVRGKDGLVVKLNEMMRDQEWSEDAWKELAGASGIDELYKIFDDSLSTESAAKSVK